MSVVAVDPRFHFDDLTAAIAEVALEHLQRATYLDGLRSVIAFLEANPDLTPNGGQGFYVFATTADELRVFAEALMQGAGIGEITKDVGGDYAGLVRRFGPHTFKVYTARAEVCERVEVGSETVEEPDPQALKAVPTVTVTKPVYEWRCKPLLEGVL